MTAGLGQAGMTVTTGAVFIPEVWSAEILRATKSNLVLADKVKRFDADVSKYGDVIHIPQLSNLTTNAKVANTAVTTQAPTEGEITVEISHHEETSFFVEDIAKTQSRADLMGEYTKAASYAIAKKIDGDLAALYSGLSQYVGDGSTAITDANIIEGIQKLDDADAPSQDRFFVIKPAGKADLMAIDKFVLRTGAGWGPSDSPIINGEKAEGFWGDLYGVKVFISTNLVTAAGTPTVVHNLLFQRDAFALAMQKAPRVQSQYKLEYLSNLVTVDVIYGVKELRDSFAVDYRSKA